MLGRRKGDREKHLQHRKESHLYGQNCQDVTVARETLSGENCPPTVPLPPPPLPPPPQLHILALRRWIPQLIPLILDSEVYLLCTLLINASAGNGPSRVQRTPLANYDTTE